MITKHRTIKKSVVADIPVIMQLLECGRQKMRANGNLEQWTDGNPKQSLIEADINNGNSYILEEEGKAVATFAFIEGPDITYNNIYDGDWKENTLPYHVIHRMASLHGTHGVFKDILEYCFERCNNIRIDTHSQNSIMRNALSKYGFEYCGIIYLLDGAERLAFQQTRIESNNK